MALTLMKRSHSSTASLAGISIADSFDRSCKRVRDEPERLSAEQRLTL